MKPVRAERLAEAVRRVVDARDGAPDAASDDETIAVELGGVTRFVQRSQVRYVEAQGDYARLHTASESHLVRIPLAALEDRWGAAGFVRIHRSTLVALRHVDEVRSDAGRFTVRLGDDELVVSRRHTRELRDRLIRSARPSRP
jgi:DNA-binding LytR/AlgR family response regulator